MNKLILLEKHKEAVCKFHECSNEAGKHYPYCDLTPEPCSLAELQELIEFINRFEEKEGCVNGEFMKKSG